MANVQEILNGIDALRFRLLDENPGLAPVADPLVESLKDHVMEQDRMIDRLAVLILNIEASVRSTSDIPPYVNDAINEAVEALT